MNKQDIAIIETYEEKYDHFLPVLNQLRSSLDAFEEHYQDYLDVRDFYGSDKWLELAEYDHVPVKNGILSEDQIFNLIGEHNELLGRLMTLATQMYKDL
ncbi:DUF4298 domain-containing protein [Streptococcus halichoeri]|uniref:DUF4298 domain-containing protein n=1 Tax=Streptococcus halichoeri TaxID=254785 RepID=UPI001358B555|nr:DUF4298 domain-containing protein [Streptococcus halichoeri]